MHVPTLRGKKWRLRRTSRACDQPALPSKCTARPRLENRAIKPMRTEIRACESWSAEDGHRPIHEIAQRERHRSTFTRRSKFIPQYIVRDREPVETDERTRAESCRRSEIVVPGGAQPPRQRVAEREAVRYYFEPCMALRMNAPTHWREISTFLDPFYLREKFRWSCLGPRGDAPGGRFQIVRFQFVFW